MLESEVKEDTIGTKAEAQSTTTTIATHAVTSFMITAFISTVGLSGVGAEKCTSGLWFQVEGLLSDVSLYKNMLGCEERMKSMKANDKIET